MKRVLVGFACDNACAFCPVTPPPSGQGGQRSSAAEDVEAVGPGEVVAFVGGEPCLAPELPGWVARVVERGASRVIVQTNGRRLGRDGLAAALAAAGAGRLSLDVSLHGSSAAMHEYHTTVVGSFEETTRGLSAAVAAGLRVGTTTVVTRSNFRHLSEIAELAVSLRVAAVHFAGVEPFGAALANEARLVPAAELVTPHLARAAAALRRAGVGVFAADVADPPGARDLFAGLGETQPAPAPAAPARVGLPVLGRS